MDIYKSRDVLIAETVGSMIELKYFDEQYVYYGTVYAEDGILKYRLHDNAKKLYQFLDRSCRAHLFPTNITQHVQFKKVPSGKNREIISEVQNELIEKLKQLYPKEMFRILYKIGNTKAVNSADFVLFAWQDELEFCYSIDELNLFLGAVKMAHAAKKTTDEVYDYLLSWISERNIQINKHTNVAWHEPYLIYGFLYWKNQKKYVYANAQWDIAMERLYQLLSNGLRCTPLFSKSYWLDSNPELKPFKWIELFEKDLLTIMDEKYISNLEKIWNLPTVIDVDIFQAMAHDISIKKYPEAYHVLQFYANIWGCSEI